MKNILAVIPCRGGSKGVPRKNIKLLGGIPLIQYTIEAARNSKYISDFCVSSEDQEILDIAKTLNSPTIERPTELALDETPTLPVVKHALEFLECKNQKIYDIVLILQATTPLRASEDIDDAITKLILTGCDSVVSVSKSLHGHPSKAKKIIDDHLVPFFDFLNEKEGVRRQDLPSAYYRNGGIYAFKRSLVDKGTIFGNDCRPIIMPLERSLEIDTSLDFLILESLINNPVFRDQLINDKNKI